MSWAIHLYGAWVFGGTSAWMGQAVTGAPVASLAAIHRDIRIRLDVSQILLSMAAVHDCRRRSRPYLGTIYRRLLLLIVWVTVVALVCAAVSSRVLRYMLPAYPAFSILAAIGLVSVVPVGYIRNGIRVLTPLLAAAVIGIAVFPPEVHHAAEIRPVAVAAASVTPPNGRIVFYDAGAPRYDETNQILWYSGRNVLMMFSPDELGQAIRERPTLVFVVDRDTYRKYFDAGIAHAIIAQSGRLICVRLAPSENATAFQRRIAPVLRAFRPQLAIR